MKTIPDTITINGRGYVSTERDAMPAAFAALPHHAQARFFNDLGAICEAWYNGNHGEIRWRLMCADLDESGKAVLRAMAQFLLPAGDLSRENDGT